MLSVAAAELLTKERISGGHFNWKPGKREGEASANFMIIIPVTKI